MELPFMLYQPEGAFVDRLENVYGPVPLYAVLENSTLPPGYIELLLGVRLDPSAALIVTWTAFDTLDRYPGRLLSLTAAQ